MTKVGENNNPPKMQNQKTIHHSLEMSLTKFEKALHGYRKSTREEKVHCKGVMDEQLALIKQVSEEIKRSGLHKQEVKVEHDYREFMATGSEESFAALEHDLQTLRDYLNSEPGGGSETRTPQT